MIAKSFVLILSICLVSATCSLAAPAPVPPPGITPFRTAKIAQPAPIEFPFYFQEKGADPEGHGAFVGKATKRITLSDGRILYDGMVMINPKRPDTAMVVSVGPDVILPSGRRSGTLKFGSYQMLFDTRTETIIYMNATVNLEDGEGRSLFLLYNQPEAIIQPEPQPNAINPMPSSIKLDRQRPNNALHLTPAATVSCAWHYAVQGCCRR